MKPLLLAFAIVLAGVVLMFSLLSALSVPKEIAGSASSIFLPAITYVHKQLDRRSKQPIPAFSKRKIVPLEGFLLPGAVVLCYGILVALAATHVPGAIAGFIADVSGVQAKQFVPFVMLSTLPIQLVFLYLVARWIGVRSGAKGIWLLLIVFTVVSTADNVIRLLFLPSELRESLGVNVPSVAWRTWIVDLISSNVLALLGFWRGRRIQLRRYADYLLKKVKPETRLVALSLLRDEIVTISLKSSGEPANGISETPRWSA